MGSLSADKAAVGSAVNDTTRQLGGTLASRSSGIGTVLGDPTQSARVVLAAARRNMHALRRESLDAAV